MKALVGAFNHDCNRFAALLRNRIRKVFYYNRDDQMPGRFPGYYPLDESKDHHSADCEADLLAMFDKPQHIFTLRLPAVARKLNVLFNIYYSLFTSPPRTERN